MIQAAVKSGNEIRNVNLDAENRRFTVDGIDDFYYPVTRETHTAFATDIMRAYASIVNSSLDHEDASLYKVLGKYYISEAIATFQGQLLKEKLLNAGHDFNVPQNWRLWPVLFAGKVPEPPAFVQNFYNGPQKANYKKKLFSVSFWKRVGKLMRLKKGGLNVSGLIVKPITKSVLEQDIIATQRLPLIIQHAKNESRDVVFANSSRWFLPVDEQNTYPVGALDDQIINATAGVFEQCGVTFAPYIETYLRHLMQKSIHAYRVHYKRLLAQENLPKTLWIGTSGHIWDSLLKIAVKAQGGYVCGHDHGTGQGHLVTPLMGIVELWGGDAFYTFSAGHAAGLAQGAPAWSIMDKTPLNVTGVGTEQPIVHGAIPDKEIKNIFLVSVIYDRDRGRMYPLNPDIPQLDWQARLLAKLSAQGYRMTMKAHPESAFATPPDFQTVIKADINKERFETVLNDADMFIFDSVPTSTFKDALVTNKPIIITDFKDLEWTEDARQLIEKRCVFIDGYYDENNRCQVDWSAFDGAIKEAKTKAANTEFYNKYYC